MNLNIQYKLLQLMIISRLMNNKIILALLLIIVVHSQADDH